MKNHPKLVAVGTYSLGQVEGMLSALRRQPEALEATSPGRIQVSRRAVVMFLAEQDPSGSWQVTTIPGLLTEARKG